MPGTLFHLRSRCPCPAALVALALNLLVAPCLPGQEPPPPADGWLKGEGVYPPSAKFDPGRDTGFESLKAEVLVGKLKLYWEPATMGDTSNAVIVASYDAPGHWPARDWRRIPMQARGRRWETSVPVENLDVPVIYFVEARQHGKATTSRMRVARPRELGLEMPSRIPWPFLDGLELGMDGWQLLDDPTFFPPLTVSPLAHDGDHSLAVKLPAGKRSVTVATSRLRGWLIQQHAASGVSLWLRSVSGQARVRFTIQTHARTDRQIVAAHPDEVEVTAEWQPVNLLFDRLPSLVLADVDRLTLEFVGVGPGEFLIDDLELISRNGLGTALPVR